jgi:hypothetical protein
MMGPSGGHVSCYDSSTKCYHGDGSCSVIIIKLATVMPGDALWSLNQAYPTAAVLLHTVYLTMVCMLHAPWRPIDCGAWVPWVGHTQCQLWDNGRRPCKCTAV